MTEIRRLSFIKPTLDTPFHIDFNWWKSHDNNWRVFLANCLCKEHQPLFMYEQNDIPIDWIDSETAEIQTVDGLQHILMEHCAKQPEFLSENSTLVDNTFRVFLANGNTPLSVKELSAKINKPAEIILKTFSGHQVYKGIRPFDS
jgi:hypothetical protein